MQNVIGAIIMGIGILFMLFGVIGMFRFKSFYPRVLVASKVDTVGAVTFLIGLAVRHGFSWFSGRLVLIMLIILILNPLVAHILVRSAGHSDYNVDETDE